MSTVEPVWRRLPDVVHRTLAGISVLRSLADGETVILRSTLSLVWIALEAPASVHELVDDLRSVEVRVSELEIESGLAELASLGFVRADD